MFNKDFFANFKAQAWWNGRQLFYNTWRAVTKGEKFPANQLISIDCAEIGDTSILHKLRDELSQVVATTSTGKMKWTIVKAPTNTVSPNMADSLVMCFWPMPLVMPGEVTSFFAPQIIRAA